MQPLLLSVLLMMQAFTFSNAANPEKLVRVLVITGGHGYNTETFQSMLSGLGDVVSFQIAEFPQAYDMFLPENSSKYDVLVFYHMWQKITEEQKHMLSTCISGGKPLVVMHHSICAFDGWDEYARITGGKYFQKPGLIDGKEHVASSYLHDVNFRVRVSDSKHPVTKGIADFDIYDETYKDLYVAPNVKPLLETKESSSTPVIGWCHTYGRARVVSIQPGHDTPAFENPNYRKLILQAILWANGAK